MKRIVLLFLLTLSLVGHAQSNSEINLSKTLLENRLGLWENGDYKIYVSLDSLEKAFRSAGEQSLKFAQTYGSSDSTYLFTAQRYLKAADQLKTAENGFDLRSLVLYHGRNIEQNNAGNSYIVHSYVQAFVQAGNAIVYYKGTRVYVLRQQTILDGQGLMYDSTTVTYVDDIENYAFKDYHHYGW
ncbi:MAG: hypothetical protein ACRCYO_18095 [Bacteroidia bacterium]